MADEVGTDWASLDDVVLVQQAARGAPEALSTLYDRYQSLMFTTAVRMLGSAPAAEDLVHDVFLEVWRHSHAYDPNRGSVRTWILVRLRSRGLDRLRAASKRREVAQEPSSDGHEHFSIDLSPLVDRHKLHANLATLPDNQREVLELAYFRGLTSREIADTLEIPIGTVKSRTAAALDKLRTMLNQHERLRS